MCAMRNRPRSGLRWAAVIGWMSTIFVLSSIQGSSFPSGSSSLGHFVEYAVLGALLVWALVPHASTLRAAAIAVLVASAYGVTDELHQLLTPQRAADVYDWGVDTVSAAVGALAVAAAVAWLSRKRSGPPLPHDSDGPERSQ